MYSTVFRIHHELTLLRSEVVQLIDCLCQLPQLTLGEMLHQKRKKYLYNIVLVYQKVHQYSPATE
jgi:hypothetical protein